MSALDARFCGDCGSSLAREDPLPARGRSPDEAGEGPAEAERKRVSVLFCDIVGSTGISERIGAEAMHDLLDRFVAIAAAEVERLGGLVHKVLGDGLMALVGVPRSREDHAEIAVLIALTLRRRLGAEALVASNEEPLQVRIGVNSGLVVVGSLGQERAVDYTAVGDVVNVAARLQSLADPGQILIGEATARLVSGRFQLEHLGQQDIRGRDRPATTYRVVSADPESAAAARSREGAPFVGRDRSLAQLRDLLDQTLAGEGQVVSLIGEPGIGKSRLLAEFREVLSSGGIECLQGRCRSYGETIPYLPLIGIVRQAIGVSSAAPPDAVRTGASDALTAAGLEPCEHLPYLLDVLGAADGEPVLAQLSSGAIRARTFETMRLLLLASGRPLVLAIEDVQWIDRTSEEFLGLLAERGAGRPLLLVTTQRPGRRLRWMELSHANQIALGRLRAEDALTVARAVAGADVGDDVLAAIVERADGNPFFLEELVRDIADVEEHDPRRVPDTVQGVLSARIDRLSESGRHVLRAASVLGRTFAPTLLAELLPGEELAEVLDEVARQELLVERPGPTGSMLSFRHALTQEVAYDGLLSTRRRALHARAGAALERLSQGRTDDALERLAHHFAHSDRPDMAVEYLTRLAAAAAARHANAESAKILEEALRQAAALAPERREAAVIEITLALVSSLYFLGRLERCQSLLVDQSTRVEALGDASLLARHYFLLAHTLSHLADWEGAEHASLLAISVGERSGHVAEVGKAHYVLARESAWKARYQIGVEHGARAARLLEGVEERWWLAYANSWLATNFAFLADFPSAFESAGRASALGEALGDLRIQAYVNGHTGWFEAMRGEGRRAIDRAQRALELATDPLGSALATAVLGLGLREVGDHEAAGVAFSRAIDEMDRFGYRRLVCWYTAWRAESWLGRGDLDTAERDARQALAASVSLGSPWGAAICERTLGRVAAARGEAAAAKAHFLDALSAFESVEANLETAVTLSDLGELALACSEPECAHHLESARAILAAIDAPAHAVRVERLLKHTTTTGTT